MVGDKLDEDFDLVVSSLFRVNLLVISISWKKKIIYIIEGWIVCLFIIVGVIKKKKNYSLVSKF